MGVFLTFLACRKSGLFYTYIVPVAIYVITIYQHTDGKVVLDSFQCRYVCVTISFMSKLEKTRKFIFL